MRRIPGFMDTEVDFGLSDIGAGGLERALRQLDWTGKELARRTGKDENTVSKWRKSRLPVPRYAAEIMRLALRLQSGAGVARRGG